MVEITIDGTGKLVDILIWCARKKLVCKVSQLLGTTCVKICLLIKFVNFTFILHTIFAMAVRTVTHVDIYQTVPDQRILCLQIVL